MNESRDKQRTVCTTMPAFKLSEESYQGITVRHKSFGFWDMWSRLDLGAMVFARICGSAVCSASGHMRLTVKLALCSLNLGSQLPQAIFPGLTFFFGTDSASHHIQGYQYTRTTRRYTRPANLSLSPTTSTTCSPKPFIAYHPSTSRPRSIERTEQDTMSDKSLGKQCVSFCYAYQFVTNGR